MINVLIVEDDPMVGELNKRYLSQIDGFQLKGIASSFQSALHILGSTILTSFCLIFICREKTGWNC